MSQSLILCGYLYGFCCGCCFVIFYLKIFFAVLGIEPRALHMLGISVTELHTQIYLLGYKERFILTHGSVLRLRGLHHMMASSLMR
jgi:hypothetical protein